MSNDNQTQGFKCGYELCISAEGKDVARPKAGLVTAPPNDPEWVRTRRRPTVGHCHEFAWFLGLQRQVWLQLSSLPGSFCTLGAIRTNAGNAEQFEKLIQMTLTVLLKVAID